MSESAKVSDLKGIAEKIVTNAKIEAERIIAKAEEAAKILTDIENDLSPAPTISDSQAFIKCFQDESTKTIATLIVYLPLNQAAELLESLSDIKQLEIINTCLEMKNVGVEHIAEILNIINLTAMKEIIAGIKAKTPELAKQIRTFMFIFEDIILIPDDYFPVLLNAVSNNELTLALKTASTELKQKVFRNMPESTAQVIEKNLEEMGPTRLTEVESAQQRIVDIVRRLEESGEVIIAGRGGDDEVVV